MKFLPKTETPSASEVGVPEYIDDIVGHFWSKEDQESFREGMKKINDHSKELYSIRFQELSEEHQNILMDKLVDEAKNHSGKSRPFFLQLKALTYSGYFSSEMIGEHVMAYDPVPGEYIGDLPLNDIDKAWSL